MVKKSKLFAALDAHKGRDYEKERQKKLAKAAEKKKKAQKKGEAKEDDEKNVKATEEVEVNDDGDEEEQEDEEIGGVKLTEDKDNEESEEEEEEEEEEIEGEEEEEDIPLSDLSEDERADVIPHQRLTINNSAAINASIKRISFITSQTPFSEHNSLVSTEDVDVPDPNDDLTRELAFYKVCQAAAIEARRTLKKEGVPFTRPTDYFAEMVKTDEHMTKIKKKLFDEAASKKAAADARRQRDLKKFGKQVQVAKLQQRQKEKKETLEKINSLKRKRKTESTGPTDNDNDLFDVAIDNDNNKKPSFGGRRGGGKDAAAGGANPKRQKKNEKYGFGGKKRFAKSGDAMSSADLRGFSAKKMKAGGGSGGGAKKRPGKSRRNAMK